MTAPRRDNALREQGVGANKSKLSHKNRRFRRFAQTKGQPSPGAIGDALYKALFGGKGAPK